METKRRVHCREKDQAISPDEERFFAKRMNATITELNTSHVPMLSKPKEVAALSWTPLQRHTKSSPKGAFTAAQNLTASGAGSRDNHRFEDAFNRSDAAGAAGSSTRGCPRPAARAEIGKAGTGSPSSGRGRASNGRAAVELSTLIAGARRRGI